MSGVYQLTLIDHGGDNMFGLAEVLVEVAATWEGVERHWRRERVRPRSILCVVFLMNACEGHLAGKR